MVRDGEFTEFQSTLPARGATRCSEASKPSAKISIHAPRTGSDALCVCLLCASVISIHAPRTGSDHTAIEITAYKGQFQSTLPARGATMTAPARFAACGISIHAPRTGSDQYSAAFPPCIGVFQSTLPARGATWELLRHCVRNFISIHAPRTGSDYKAMTDEIYLIYFNPRSPHGERHHRRGGHARIRGFQSTLPARGATRR